MIQARAKSNLSGVVYGRRETGDTFSRQPFDEASTDSIRCVRLKRRRGRIPLRAWTCGQMFFGLCTRGHSAVIGSALYLPEFKITHTVWRGAALCWSVTERFFVTQALVENGWVVDEIWEVEAYFYFDPTNAMQLHRDGPQSVTRRKYIKYIHYTYIHNFIIQIYIYI